MSNQVYINKLYNEKVKKLFLNTVEKNLSSHTVIAYKRILNRANPLEKRFQKVLYDFKFEEIERYIVRLNPISINSGIQTVSLIENYIKWAILKGLTATSINPLENMSKRDIGEKYANKLVKNHLTYDEVAQAVELSKKDQDKALIWPYFMGYQAKSFVK